LFLFIFTIVFVFLIFLSFLLDVIICLKGYILFCYALAVNIRELFIYYVVNKYSMSVDTMNVKSLSIAIVLVMLSSTFIVAASVERNHNEEDNVVNNNIEIKEIKVALVSQNLLIVSGQHAFVNILDGYSWVAGNTQYIFSVSQISDKNIYKGELTTENYDLILMPGGGGGGHSILHSPLVKIWRKKMIDFIKDGGGYYGVCGGTYFILGLDRPPRTLNERAFDKSSLGVSCVNLSFISYANPIFCQFAGLGPEAVGHIAYMFYSGWDYGFARIYPSGLCFDVPVDRSHPFFDDYLDDTARIRWVGGPGYSITDNPGREVTVLARFPEEEISDNETMRIHVWKYTGRIRGLVKGTLRHIKEDRSLFKDSFANCLFMAPDWERTNEIMKTNFSNKPYMTAEVYPNENKARIFLCSGHPEMQVWWGGKIMEVEDNDKNTLYDGLHGWENAIPKDETVEDELTHTWWMVRRGVAWAAKVPDNDLPPVYGHSQVSDIYPYEQLSAFTIEGNAETADGIMSLDLHYRHSPNNETSWSNWIKYGTDDDGSDGWSWEFNPSSANNSGYYQFYSIRHVAYHDHTETETVPPGPDAIVHVGAE